MNISIMGAGGFLGRRIAAQLAADGHLAGQAIGSLTLFDIAPPPAPSAPFPVRSVGGDIAELPADAIPDGTGVVFHLAAILHALDEEKAGASALVRRIDDPAIASMVAAWPAAFEPLRARTLGFTPHEPLPDLVRAFVADDLETTRRERGLI